MACNHPLQAWRSRSGPDRKTGHWPLVFDIKAGIPKKEVWVPCGRCIGCRLERSRQWATRCLKEASMNDENCFLTLTYDYEHLQRRCRIKDETSDKVEYSLNKKDMQLFLKRLRKEIWKNEHRKIRFFQCGEYGEQFGRPHHHAAIFGWKPMDMCIWKNRGRGGPQLWTSETLSRIWGNGYVVIGEVTFESAAYIARYITKKILGKDADSHYNGRQPEYTTMSLRPGIAKSWYQKFRGDLEQDSCHIRGNIFTRPPKYFDKLLEIENLEELERRKQERTKKAIENKLNRKEMLKREQLLKHKFNSKRSYENG